MALASSPKTVSALHCVERRVFQACACGVQCTDGKTKIASHDFISWFLKKIHFYITRFGLCRFFNNTTGFGFCDISPPHFFTTNLTRQESTQWITTMGLRVPGSTCEAWMEFGTRCWMKHASCMQLFENVREEEGEVTEPVAMQEQDMDDLESVTSPRSIQKTPSGIT